MLDESEVKPKRARPSTMTRTDRYMPKGLSRAGVHPEVYRHDKVLGPAQPVHLFDIALKAALQSIADYEETNVALEIRKACKLWVMEWERRNERKVYDGEWPHWLRYYTGASDSLG